MSCGWQHGGADDEETKVLGLPLSSFIPLVIFVTCTICLVTGLFIGRWFLMRPSQSLQDAEAEIRNLRLQAEQEGRKY